MYVLNQSDQKRILRSCELVFDDRQNWRKEYNEKESETIWVEYYPHSGMHGGGPVYLKEKETESSIFVLADKYLTSERDEDWIGFVTDLSLTIDETEKLVAYMEERKEAYPIGALQILHDRIQINRGSLIGKHVSEIDQEVPKISELMNRIKNLQQLLPADVRTSRG
ncbi:MAG: Imm27 family immunity protein [Pseudomonadota bacterium]